MYVESWAIFVFIYTPLEMMKYVPAQFIPNVNDLLSWNLLFKV